MRTWVVFRKCIQEHLRHWAILILALGTAPFFVLVYHMVFSDEEQTFQLAVVVEDAGVMGAELRAIFGAPFRLRDVADASSAEKMLANRDLDVLLVLPREFTASVHARAEGGAPVPIELRGDMTSARYVTAAILAGATVEQFVEKASGQPRLVRYDEKQIGGAPVPNVFNSAVPGLLVMAIIMLLFTASLAIIKEVEGGTMLRLRLSPLRPLEFMTAVCVSEVLVGLTGMAVALGCARLVGYQTRGSLALAALVGILSCLSIVAVSLMVAAVSRTANDILIIGNFPFFLLFFFSGSAFPVPKVGAFSAGGFSVGIQDLLPPTHSVAAMNKVLSLQAGLRDIHSELIGLAVLTVVYFAAGGWMFTRRHLRSN